MQKYSALIQKITEFAQSSPLVDAIVVIGSQARVNTPADEYSDLDLLFFVKDTDYFIFNDEWLHTLGNFHISFIEDTVGGEKERRVLFEGCLDIDFVILPSGITVDSSSGAILSRGYRVLVDKIGIGAALDKLTFPPNTYTIMAEAEFLNLANDFWYHTIWTVKKIKRGELWTAKSCADSYLKYILLRVIELQAHVNNGPDYDTWHNGRLIEKWADGSVIARIPLVFSRYEPKEMIKALQAIMELFRIITMDISKKLGYSYPHKADSFAQSWIMTECAEELAQ